MRLLLALLLFAPLPVLAQRGLQPQERLATGFLRAGYRVPHDDTTDARQDVTVQLGDISVRRTLAYPDSSGPIIGPIRSFRIYRAGQEIFVWSEHFEGAWDEGFDVLVGDLDGARAREILVVQHLGTGNGLGVATWQVNVLEENGASPLVFRTVDYGPSGLVVRRPVGLRLMAASWEEGTEPGRGAGLYYTARFYRYADGRLVPEAPVLQRRFLYSFQHLRGREAEAGRYHPDRWITRNVRRAPRDPGVPEGTRLATEPVTVLAVVPGEGVRVRHADGRIVPVGLVGDAATGLLFPEGYVPLGAVEAWRQGQTLRLDTYPSPYAEDERSYVLWVER